MEHGIDMKLTNGNVKMFLNGQLIVMSAKDRGILRMKFKTIWPAEANVAKRES